MDSFEKSEKQREARRRLAAQRDRAGRLRGRVVAGSLVCFAVLWGIVFGQMASGNDPVLAGKSAAGGSETRRDSRSDPPRTPPPTEAIETTEPDEVESQVTTPLPVEEEVPVEEEIPVEEEVPVEVEPEFEPEPEPVTTEQS